jgi:phage terminase small subunit
VTQANLLLVRMCFPRQRLKHGMEHLEQLEYLEYLEPAHKSVFTLFCEIWRIYAI